MGSYGDLWGLLEGFKAKARVPDVPLLWVFRSWCIVVFRVNGGLGSAQMGDVEYSSG